MGIHNYKLTYKARQGSNYYKVGIIVTPRGEGQLWQMCRIGVSDLRDGDVLFLDIDGTL